MSGVWCGDESFLNKANKIDFDAPIFIDVSLANGIRSQVVMDGIHQLGFTEIDLSIGYQAADLESPPFIKRVVGKEFPLFE